MKKKILYNGQKYSTVEEFTEALDEYIRNVAMMNFSLLN